MQLETAKPSQHPASGQPLVANVYMVTPDLRVGGPESQEATDSLSFSLEEFHPHPLSGPLCFPSRVTVLISSFATVFLFTPCPPPLPPEGKFQEGLVHICFSLLNP